MKKYLWLTLLLLCCNIKSASADTDFGDLTVGVMMKTAAETVTYVTGYAQPLDADLTTYAGITPSANVQSLLGAANYSAMRTQLSLVPGTDVQAQDAELAAFAGVTSAADRVFYFTGSGTGALQTFTAAGRSMVGAADATAQTALLNPMVGDSGAGGTKGLAPAPAAGDAAAGKFLKADGSYQVPTGSGAPSDATYWMSASHAGTSAEVVPTLDGGVHGRTGTGTIEVTHASEFGGRVRWTSTTSLVLESYTSSEVTVNGYGVGLGSSGISLTTAENLISSTGTDAGAAMGASTVYYIYVSNSQASFAASDVRASTTAPTNLTAGTHPAVGYYLGSSGNALHWRYCGVCRTNGSTQFVDSETQRFVINHHNQIPLRLFTCPAYNDNSTISTPYTTANTTWVAANAGTGSKVEWLQDARTNNPVFLSAYMMSLNSGANATYCGIGVDSTSNSNVIARTVGTSGETASCEWSLVPTIGYHAADLLICVSGGTGSYYADIDDFGGSDDSRSTYLKVWIKG